jgi:hypothetical protein
MASSSVRTQVRCKTRETGLTSGFHLSVIERGVGWHVRRVDIGNIWAGRIGCQKEKEKKANMWFGPEKKTR